VVAAAFDIAGLEGSFTHTIILKELFAGHGQSVGKQRRAPRHFLLFGTIKRLNIRPQLHGSRGFTKQPPPYRSLLGAPAFRRWRGECHG
jgi:hypothetical protein